MPIDTGWVIAGAGANVNTGDAAWANPSRITADDGSVSTANQGDGQTDTLKASNFGFTIPEGSTILGIETRAQLRRENALSTSASFSHVNIGKSDSVLGTSKNPGDSISTSLTNYDDGGATDLWGLSLTAAEINASTFQVRIRATADVFVSNIDLDCGAIWCRVYYTPLLTAAVGTFILTGKTAGLATGAAVSGDAGVFALAGQAATLVHDFGFVIAAEVGSFLVEVVTEVILVVKLAVARVVKTTYDVRPFLRKFRRSAPRLEE